MDLTGQLCAWAIGCLEHCLVFCPSRVSIQLQLQEERVLQRYFTCTQKLHLSCLAPCELQQVLFASVHWGDAMQGSICTELIQRLCEYRPQLSRAVAVAAEVDCLISLASTAREHHYIRPLLTRDNVLHIKQGDATSCIRPILASDGEVHHLASDTKATTDNVLHIH